MELLLRLLIAHLIGDFILQSDNWVKEKETKKLASGKLYFHVLIHGLLSLLLIWNLSLWYIAVIISISHLVIDAGKILIQNEKSKRLLFFIDQFLHLLVITIIATIHTEPIEIELTNQHLLVVLSIIFLAQPASILVKTLISVYTPKTEIGENESLVNAGKYIGILERLLVFVFIATDHWEGVGFLIAAKSIFRFSDLTESKDRKLTEYILIGTLLSFGIAILVGLLFINFTK